MSRERIPRRINPKNPESREVMAGTDAIMKAYRGWDALEKPRGIDIIDFDLVPPVEAESFRSREEVLDRLRSLHDDIRPTNSQEKFIKAKLNASTYYLRALMGEDIPYEEYVENITGIRPQLISEEEVQEQRALMDGLLRDVGYRPERESFEDFASRIKIKKVDAEREAKGCEDTLIPIALQSLGLEDLEFPHEIRLVEERNYWMIWNF